MTTVAYYQEECPFQVPNRLFAVLPGQPVLPHVAFLSPRATQWNMQRPLEGKDHYHH